MSEHPQPTVEPQQHPLEQQSGVQPKDAQQDDAQQDKDVHIVESYQPNRHYRFVSAFIQTLKAIFLDKGVVLMLVVAPVIYGFFYPWPYATEVVQQVPVGIVDNDNSTLSKTIIRYASASPYLQVHRYADEPTAQQGIWQDDIAGYLLIPPNLENNVSQAKPASVSVMGNGGYLLLSKNVQLGFSQAIGTVSAGIEIKRSVAQGTYISTAQANSQAIPLRIDPMYNTSEGYGAYVVPAVAILILQQTLLMGTALLIGTWYERREHHANIRGWLGRIMALSLVSFVVGCFYYGWVFAIHDYPHGNNLAGSLLFLALFCPTVATLGCFFGMWFRQRERSLQILIFSSLPFFFLSGYPWPSYLLPEPLYWLGWLLPSTSAMHTSVQLDQMGASVAMVAPMLWHLLALMGLYLLMLLAIESPAIRRWLGLKPIR